MLLSRVVVNSNQTRPFLSRLSYTSEPGATKCSTQSWPQTPGLRGSWSAFHSRLLPQRLRDRQGPWAQGSGLRAGRRLAPTPPHVPGGPFPTLGVWVPGRGERSVLAPAAVVLRLQWQRDPPLVVLKAPHNLWSSHPTCLTAKGCQRGRQVGRSGTSQASHPVLPHHPGLRSLSQKEHRAVPWCPSLGPGTYHSLPHLPTARRGQPGELPATRSSPAQGCEGICSGGCRAPISPPKCGLGAHHVRGAENHSSSPITRPSELSFQKILWCLLKPTQLLAREWAVSTYLLTHGLGLLAPSPLSRMWLLHGGDSLTADRDTAQLSQDQPTARGAGSGLRGHGAEWQLPSAMWPSALTRHSLTCPSARF